MAVVNDALFVPEDRLLILHYKLWDTVIHYIKLEFDGFQYTPDDFKDLLNNKFINVAWYVTKKKKEALYTMLDCGIITKEEFDCVSDTGECFLCAYYSNRILHYDGDEELHCCSFCDTLKIGLANNDGCLGGLYYRLISSKTLEELLIFCEIIRDVALDE